MNQHKHQHWHQHVVTKTVVRFGNLLHFCYKITWKQQHEWPGCFCADKHLCRQCWSLKKHAEHITASPRNDTGPQCQQPSINSDDFCFLFQLLLTRDNIWSQWSPSKETEAESNYFIVLLSSCPKGFRVCCGCSQSYWQKQLVRLHKKIKGNIFQFL